MFIHICGKKVKCCLTPTCIAKQTNNLSSETELKYKKNVRERKKDFLFQYLNSGISMSFQKD